MKFLGNLPNPEKKEQPDEVIQVDKMITLNLDCIYCDENGAMEGGPVGDGKAKFLCGFCRRVNIIKWNIDI